VKATVAESKSETSSASVRVALIIIGMLLGMSLVGCASAAILYDFEVVDGTFTTEHHPIHPGDVIGLDLSVKFRSVQDSDPVDISIFAYHPDTEINGMVVAEYEIGRISNRVLVNNVTTPIHFDWTVDVDPGPYKIAAFIDPSEILSRYDHYGGGNYSETYEWNNIEFRYLLVTEEGADPVYSSISRQPVRNKPTYRMDWSPDGSQIATGDSDGNIIISDSLTGAAIHSYSTFPSYIHSVSYNPNGTLLLVSGGNRDQGYWGIWTTDTWELVGGSIKQAHSADIWSSSWSPTGDRFITTGGQTDRIVYIWDTHTREIIKNITGHLRDVFDAEWSPNGDHLVTTGYGSLLLWDGNDYSFIREIDVDNQGSGLEWSPDGAYLSVTGVSSNRGDITIYDSSDWSIERMISIVDSGAGEPSWNSNGSMLAVSSLGYLWLVEPDSGDIVYMGSDKPDSISSPVWSPNGTHLAYMQSGDENRIVVMTGGSATGVSNETLTIDYSEMTSYSIRDSPITTIDLSPDGHVFITGDESGVVYLRYTHDGSIKSYIGQFNSPINSVSFSPDGRRFLVGGGDSDNGFLEQYLMNSLDGVYFYEQFSSNVLYTDWSPDGRYFISSGGMQDPSIRIWNSTTYTQIANLSGHVGDIMSVKWSPDGRWIASGGDGGLIIWDGDNYSLQSQFIDYQDIQDLDWSPDSAFLAVTDRGNDDGEVFIINTSDMMEGRAITLADKQVDKVSWSPNGSVISITSESGNLWLFDPNTGDPSQYKQVFDQLLLDLDWNEDGSFYMYSTYDDSPIIHIDVSREAWDDLSGYTGEIPSGNITSQSAELQSWYKGPYYGFNVSGWFLEHNNGVDLPAGSRVSIPFMLYNGDTCNMKVPIEFEVNDYITHEWGPFTRIEYHTDPFIVPGIPDELDSIQINEVDTDSLSSREIKIFSLIIDIPDMIAPDINYTVDISISYPGPADYYINFGRLVFQVNRSAQRSMNPDRTIILFNDAHRPFISVDPDAPTQSSGIGDYSYPNGGGLYFYQSVGQSHEVELLEWRDAIGSNQYLNSETIDISDVLVIPAVEASFSTEETDLIEVFVRTGGGALIMGYQGLYGIATMNLLSDLEWGELGLNSPPSDRVIEGNTILHPNGFLESLTEEVTSLKITRPSYIETPPSSEQVENYTPLINVDGYTIAAAFNYHEGKVVIVTDTFLFGNQHLFQEDNGIFGKAIMDWLSDNGTRKRHPLDRVSNETEWQEWNETQSQNPITILPVAGAEERVCVPGNKCSYAVEVINSDNKEHTVLLEASAPQGWLASFKMDSGVPLSLIDGVREGVVLGAHEDVFVYITLEAPTDEITGQPGNYTTKIWANSTTSGSGHSENTTITSTIEIRNLIEFDDDDDITRGCRSGDTCTFEHTIYNNDITARFVTITAIGNIWDDPNTSHYDPVQLFESYDGGSTWSLMVDDDGIYTTMQKVDPWGYMLINMKMDVPLDAGPSDLINVYITASVEEMGAFDMVRYTLDVIPPKPIMITAIDETLTGLPGEEMAFEFFVVNHLSSAQYVTVRLKGTSSDDILAPFDSWNAAVYTEGGVDELNFINVDRWTIPNLQPDYQYRIHVKLTIPPESEANTELGLTVMVMDINEVEHGADVTVIVDPSGLLIQSPDDELAEGYPGETLIFQVDIENWDTNYQSDIIDLLVTPPTPNDPVDPDSRWNMEIKQRDGVSRLTSHNDNNIGDIEVGSMDSNNSDIIFLRVKIPTNVNHNLLHTITLKGISDNTGMEREVTFKVVVTDVIFVATDPPQQTQFGFPNQTIKFFFTIENLGPEEDIFDIGFNDKYRDIIELFVMTDVDGEAVPQTLPDNNRNDYFDITLRPGVQERRIMMAEVHLNEDSGQGDRMVIEVFFHSTNHPRESAPMLLITEVTASRPHPIQRQSTVDLYIEPAGSILKEAFEVINTGDDNGEVIFNISMTHNWTITIRDRMNVEEIPLTFLQHDESTGQYLYTFSARDERYITDIEIPLDAEPRSLNNVVYSATSSLDGEWHPESYVSYSIQVDDPPDTEFGDPRVDLRLMNWSTGGLDIMASYIAYSTVEDPVTFTIHSDTISALDALSNDDVLMVDSTGLTQTDIEMIQGWNEAGGKLIILTDSFDANTWIEDYGVKVEGMPLWDGKVQNTTDRPLLSTHFNDEDLGSLATTSPACLIVTPGTIYEQITTSSPDGFCDTNPNGVIDIEDRSAFTSPIPFGVKIAGTNLHGSIFVFGDTDIFNDELWAIDWDDNGFTDHAIFNLTFAILNDTLPEGGNLAFLRTGGTTTIKRDETDVSEEGVEGEASYKMDSEGSIDATVEMKNTTTGVEKLVTYTITVEDGLEFYYQYSEGGGDSRITDSMEVRVHSIIEYVDIDGIPGYTHGVDRGIASMNLNSDSLVFPTYGTGLTTEGIRYSLGNDSVALVLYIGSPTTGPTDVKFDLEVNGYRFNHPDGQLALRIIVPQGNGGLNGRANSINLTDGGGRFFLDWVEDADNSSTSIPVTATVHGANVYLSYGHTRTFIHDPTIGVQDPFEFRVTERETGGPHTLAVDMGPYILSGLIGTLLAGLLITVLGYAGYRSLKEEEFPQTDLRAYRSFKGDFERMRRGGGGRSG